MSPSLDRTKLAKFIRDDDRAFNPIFVGRDEIMDNIRLLAHDIAWHPTDSPDRYPARGKMQLIQGAPGIGKTSLLYRLAMQYRPLPARQANHPYVLPVTVPASSHLSLGLVADSIHRALLALDKNPRKAVLKGIAGVISRLNGIHLSLPFVGGAGFSLNKTDRSPPAGRPAVPDLPWGCAILLLIDEIQTVPPSAQVVLQYLEDGSDGMPILPVLAGLSNSSHVLQEVGLSRLAGDAIIQPPALGPTDVHQALAAFVRRFGIRATDDTQERWAGSLWQWSRGWPKHMQNALKIMGRRLLYNGGDLNDLQPLAIQPDIVAARHAYYRQRLGSWSGQAARIGRFMARLGRDPVPEDQVEHLLHETGLVAERSLTRSPVLTTMLRLGLLDVVQAGTDLLACPIPSLRSFVVAQTGTPLHTAAQTGTRSAFTSLPSTTDVKARDAWQRTPLHLAAQENWPLVVTEILKTGHDPETRDRWDRTALHVAAADNAAAVARLLLQSGADMQAIDDSGCTPLHRAAGAGAPQTVGLLLDEGAAIDTIDTSGRSPLHEAARANAPACIRPLLRAGAAIQATDHEDNTPLHWAAQANARDAVQTLLDAGAQSDVRNDQNQTPVDMAPAGGAAHRLLTDPDPPATSPDEPDAGRKDEFKP